MQLTGRYRWCLLIAVTTTATVFPGVRSAGDCLLARDGQAEAVIVTGKYADPFHHWVAGELQRYLQELRRIDYEVLVEMF